MDDPVRSDLAQPEFPQVAEKKKVQGEAGLENLGLPGDGPQYRGLFSELGHHRPLYHDTGQGKEAISPMEP